MGKLPNGYVAMHSIGATSNTSSQGIYFDTGVYPSATLSVVAMFDLSFWNNEWLFGARNTNSSTSAGQLNLQNGTTESGTGASYIGYYNARINLGNGSLNGGKILFAKDGNEFSVNISARNLIEKTGATNTFTGTRTMYLLALNNAGTVSYGTRVGSRMHGFRIEDGGDVIRDYAPAYKKSTQEYGIYDFVNDTFTASQGTGTVATYHLLEVTHSEGGSAYCTTYNAGNVDKVYLDHRASTSVDTELTYGIPLTATADKGYAFHHWEINGNAVSTDKETNIAISSDTQIEAVFIPQIELEETTGYKLLGLQYGIGDSIIDFNTNGVVDTTTPFARFNHFANITEASIVLDATSSATTEIECEELTSQFVNNMPVFVLDPRGQVVYCGVIKSVEGNRITCREPISIFDNDYILYSKTYDSTIMYLLYELMSSYKGGLSTSKDVESSTETISVRDVPLKRMMQPFLLSNDSTLSMDLQKALNIKAPVVTETETINLMEYIFDMFNNFGVYVVPSLSYVYFQNGSTDNGQGKKSMMRLKTTNPKLYDAISLSDNLECLSNVSVDVSEREVTVLEIYNSTGNTLRGIYSILSDGTIIQQPDVLDNSHMPYENMFSFSNCKPKAILSDDSIVVLLKQYLSNAQYNHKIEFDIDLDNSLLPLDAFKMGRRIDFYSGNRLFNSIVTGIAFDIGGNEPIRKASITLGKVRNKLTIKLNLQKKK